MTNLTSAITGSRLDFPAPVFCIISDHRVFRSRSPRLFRKIIAKLGLSACYVPFMVQPGNLAKAMDSLRVLNIAGANITIPFKEKVIDYMDQLSEGANIIGAVNTVVCKRGLLKGYNTNAIGVMDALDEAGVDISGKTALVFGTGGVARAVVFILNWLRADRVWVVGRNFEKACRVAAQLSGTALPIENLGAFAEPVDLLVNATSVSSDEEAPEFSRLISELRCPVNELVYDLNYGRLQNFWQSWAGRHSVPFLDGISTLAHQASRTFALWTGIKVRPREFLS